MKMLRDVLLEDGIQILSSGKKYVATCPFHEGDREPSFTIYEDTDTYYCFGCGVWGDAVKFLIDYRHFSPQQATEYVGEEYKKVPKKTQVIKITDTVATWKFLYSAVEKYHQFLLNMPGAISYLTGRGLTEQTIAKYMLGYTDGKVLNYKWAEEIKLAQQIGLISANNYEMMSHRITIPHLLDPNEADFMIGRTVISDKVKYLGIRMPKPIFGFHEVRHSPILFIAEGQFDWLLLRQWGYPAVVLGGTHLPKYQEQLLSNRTLIIVPDQDGVGINAANKLKERFDKAYILDISRFGVKDVGEIAELPNGQQLFEDTVKEQLAWLTTVLSKPILMKWISNLVNTMPLPSI